MTQILREHVYPTSNDLVADAVQVIARCARQAITERGAFHIVLAGGNTPRAVYARLRHVNAEWPLWHVYFGDERCVPKDDPGRNDGMARDAWLDHVPIPAAQVYDIPAEQGAEQAAAVYAQVVKEIYLFDLVLLGLGEDGHTASLFPGHIFGDAVDAADVLAVHGAPKPPPDRVSLSANRLSRARRVMFLVTGAAKRRAVADWRQGRDIPARHIIPAAGVDLFMDRPAVPD